MAARDLISLVNGARTENALPALTVNEQLTVAAETYAEGLGRSGWFDHVGPEGSTLISRVEESGYRGWIYLGENLARGVRNVQPGDVVAGWMGSDGHRANLLAPGLREVGAGCYVPDQPEGRYWCVLELGARD